MNPKDLNNRFNQLPDNIQNILTSEEIGNFIEDQSNLNYLSPEKKLIVSKLTGDVLLGNLSYKNFTQTLIDQLGVNPIISKDIGQVIESKIFFPIKNDLEKIYRRFLFSDQKKSIENVKTSSTETPEKISEEEKKPVINLKIEEEEEIGETIKENELKNGKELVKEAKTSLDAVAPSLKYTSAIPKTENANNISLTENSKRSFKSFFRFKKSDDVLTEKTAPLIIGKEQEVVKPILEEKSPWVISFEDVKPKQEKVVSEVEINLGQNNKEKEQNNSSKEDINNLKQSQSPSNFVKTLSNLDISPEQYLVTKEKLIEKSEGEKESKIEQSISIEIKKESESFLKKENDVLEKEFAPVVETKNEKIDKKSETISIPSDVSIKVVNYSENGAKIPLAESSAETAFINIQNPSEKININNLSFNQSKMDVEKNQNPERLEESKISETKQNQNILNQVDQSAEQIVTEEKEKPIVSNLNFEENKIKDDKKSEVLKTGEINLTEKINKEQEEKMPNVPEENVVDLRKLKF